MEKREVLNKNMQIELHSKQYKAYIVLFRDLPTASVLNTVALLSMGLAKEMPDLVGPEVLDSDGRRHLGICQCPVILLKAKSASKLQNTYNCMKDDGFCVIPFFEHSRELMTYSEYQASTAKIPVEELILSGFGTVGEAKTLRSHLKRFSLWR